MGLIYLAIVISMFFVFVLFLYTQELIGLFFHFVETVWFKLSDTTMNIWNRIKDLFNKDIYDE